jgi:hypothetical protein
MMMRTILCGVAAVTVSLAMQGGAGAAVASPSLHAAARDIASVTPVYWICTPYNCTYIRNYPGPGADRPYVRRGPPHRPDCNYVRGPRGRWALVCP